MTKTEYYDMYHIFCWLPRSGNGRI